MKITRRHMTARHKTAAIAGAAGATIGAVALVATGVLAGSPAPSAQCRGQVTQIAAYEADASSLSADVVSTDVASQLNADVAGAGALLKLTKREGCPVTGYPGGYTLK